MCYERRRAEACVDESGTREEPGTLTQGAPVFPGSSRLAVPVCVCVCFITAGPITKLVCVTKLFASQGRCVPSIFLLNLERCGLAILPQKDVSSKG